MNELVDDEKWINRKIDQWIEQYTQKMTDEMNEHRRTAHNKYACTCTCTCTCTYTCTCKCTYMYIPGAPLDSPLLSFSCDL